MIAVWALSCALATLDYVAIGRVSKQGAGKVLAPIAAVFLLWVVGWRILLEANGYSYVFMRLGMFLLSAVLGYCLGRTQAIAPPANGLLLDAGMLTCIIITIILMTGRYFWLKLDARDVLFASVMYAVPLAGLAVASFFAGGRCHRIH